MQIFEDQISADLLNEYECTMDQELWRMQRAIGVTHTERASWQPADATAASQLSLVLIAHSRRGMTRLS